MDDNIKKISVKKNKNTKNKNNNKITIDSVNWILANKKKFPKWVTNTFKKYLLTGAKPAPSVKGKFTPFLHQKLVRDFMQVNSPNRGLLLYHGLGSGKTCTSITIAENLKNFKNVLVMTPASIRQNFIQKGLLFCGDERFQAMPSLINDYYTFISTNASNTLSQIRNVGTLNNHVIIIDEVHNLISRIVSGLMGQSKQGKEIYNLLMNATNCKIIALTGTPIVNYPLEAGILLNMLRGPLNVHIFRIIKMKSNLNSDLEKFKSHLEKLQEIDFVEINRLNKSMELKLFNDDMIEDMNLLIKTITNEANNFGLEIKYLFKQQYTAYPENDDEFDNYFLENSKNSAGWGSFRLKNQDLFMRRALGLISYYESSGKNYPDYKIEYEEVIMSNYQYLIYEKVREFERVRERMAAMKMKSGKKKDKPTSLMRIYSRMFSNFVFPKQIPRPFPSGNILEMNKNNKKDDAKVNKMIKQEESLSENRVEMAAKYKKKISKALNELDRRRDEFMTLKNLEVLSPKMKKIIENINKSPGLVLVYSQFITLEGLGILGIALKANGFDDFSSNSKKPKFAIFSGEQDYEEREKVLQIYRSDENKRGDKLKVLMISSAGAEGLDLKNVRQIHIMEPYWNEIRIKQVIGRGVRHNSHQALPEKDRNVVVYRYYSVLSTKNKNLTKEKMSTDQYVYDIALKKYAITEDILEVMKKSAIDCVLNKKDTKFEGECFSFGTDEEGLASLPDIRKDIVYGSTVTQSKRVKKKLKLAYLTANNVLVLADKKEKKIYKLTDFKNKKNPMKKKPKIKKKVRVDMNSKIVYDDGASKTGELVSIGKFDKNSKFKK